MLDRTDFASWQQWIRLYYRGKENGVNILKSIDEGPYHMVTVRETLAESKKEHLSTLNSKFVNNMLPEWGRFVTAVKLNRGLRDSNYDQLYAYIKQHETHAKENKMLIEHFSQPTVDPLALLSNVSNPQHYSTSSSASSSIQVPQPLADSSSPAEDLIENLTNTLTLLIQSYRTFLPKTNNQLRTSSNARNQATNRVGNVNQGQARPGQARTVKCYNCNGRGHIARNCTQPKRPQNSEYYKDKILLMQAQENGVDLDAELLLFLAGGQDNAFDDDAPTAQTMFMANLAYADPVTDKAGPSYDSDILSEYVKDNKMPIVHSDASFVPTDAFMPALYKGHEIIKDNHAPAIVHNTEDTLEIAKITRKKMNAKMNDPECVTRKVKITPYDYSKDNFLATFTPQKQLTPEQIFWSNDLMKLKSEALKEHD
nr:hypothetical protein [Tanacetum cinerariifolium]